MKWLKWHTSCACSTCSASCWTPFLGSEFSCAKLESRVLMWGPRGAGAETAKVARASCARTGLVPGLPCWYLKAEGVIHAFNGTLCFHYVFSRVACRSRPSIVTLPYFMAGAPQIMQSGGRWGSVFEETCFFLNWATLWCGHCYFGNSASRYGSWFLLTCAKASDTFCYRLCWWQAAMGKSLHKFAPMELVWLFFGSVWTKRDPIRAGR